MKNSLLIIFLSIISYTVQAQKSHIPQSVPFEDILIALQTDSIPLFKGAFNEIVTANVKGEAEWKDNFQEAKGKFKDRFKSYRLEDFTYKYNKEDAKLVVFYKNSEAFQISVIKKGSQWKLNEH